jgi:hypothetical protein
MERRRLMGLLLTSVGLVLGLGGMRAARAATQVENRRATFEDAIYDECNGEYVFVSGEYYEQDKITTNNDGTIIGSLQVNTHGIGISESGNEYVFNDQLSDVSTVPGGGCGVTITESDYIRLISLGSLPNMLLHTTITVGVDSNCNGFYIFTPDQLKCPGAGAP